MDYVFTRLYGSDPASRFLVADEVGLGKTLVARGLIARVLEHLQDQEERVDILYFCSNAAISTQNVNRLNISGQPTFASATRLTRLPVEVSELSRNAVNLIGLTPGTALDLKSKGGRRDERAIMYAILQGEEWNVGKGLLNMMQGAVADTAGWKGETKYAEERLDRELSQKFCRAVRARPKLVGRLKDCCREFDRFKFRAKRVGGLPYHATKRRDELTGELRHLLAVTSLKSLKPKLVILDEFQRFRDILAGETDAALLARELFDSPGVRTLLLSATPYKMLTLHHESQEDHYEDFISTLGFLLPDANALAEVREAVQSFRRSILSLATGSEAALGSARDRVQSLLLRVMCRTERVGMTRRRDAMLVEPPILAPLECDDLEDAAIADRVALAVDAHELLEYWKSSPYLLNFLRDYDVRRKIDRVAKAPPADLLASLRAYIRRQLARYKLNRYAQIPPANARMRALYAETLDKGAWRLLWMPPSMPYSRPAGPYAEVSGLTKSLVFSSWKVVPDSIAAMCSYESERRMVRSQGRTLKYNTIAKHVKPLLRFSRGREGRLTGMPALAWLFPSPALAAEIDPLSICLQGGRGSPLSRADMLAEAEAQCRSLLASLPEVGKGRIDERWYWAAPAMLGKNRRVMEWCESAGGWTAADAAHDPGTHFREHVQMLAAAGNGELELGRRPRDLARVLAELAIGSPANCALRALKRIAPHSNLDSHALLSGAARVAAGFRTLFNLPDSIALLRGDVEESYWRIALDHAIDGNLQSLLDEQVHVLLEQLGLSDHGDDARISGVSHALEESLSIRSAQVQVDEVRVRNGRVVRVPFNARCRFALRFGELTDDGDGTIRRAETVRAAFNSPFRPFVLASTSIGQEGLDFHTWCHAVVHWNLPSNPVDLEQREGRVQRYKGHAVRKNIAEKLGLACLADWNGRGDPWNYLFDRAVRERSKGSSDLVPFWIYEEGLARIERRVPLVPFSKEVGHLENLKRALALYRVVFSQPRQEDLLTHLEKQIDTDMAERFSTEFSVSLLPPGARIQ